jgi:hypothetical protein
MKKIIITTGLLASVIGIHAQQNQSPAQMEPVGDTTAFQLSLTPDIALYSRTTTVRGLALNIWGENQIEGVNIGVVNGSTGESAGFSWALVNYDDTFHGVQWGWVNYSKQEFIGWQRGLVNIDRGTFLGFQDGFVNVTEETRGLQLGLVNYAERLRGVQIGIINVALNNPWFKEFPDKLATGFPIINWSF